MKKTDKKTYTGIKIDKRVRELYETRVQKKKRLYLKVFLGILALAMFSIAIFCKI